MIKFNVKSTSLEPLYNDQMQITLGAKSKPYLYVKLPCDCVEGTTFDYGRYFCAVNYVAKKDHFGWAEILGLLPYEMLK